MFYSVNGHGLAPNRGLESRDSPVKEMSEEFRFVALSRQSDCSPLRPSRGMREPRKTRDLRRRDGYVPRPSFGSAKSSTFGSSSTLTSLKVMTRTLFTKRALR